MVTILLAASAACFCQVAEKAGPLTVSIQAVNEAVRTGEPLAVRVMLSNVGAATVRGTVRVRVTDNWKAEPAEAVPFTVAANGSTGLSFRVTPGEGSFNAQYPVHALTEFEYEGRRLLADPVNLVMLRQPNPPRARLPLEWKPIPISGARALGLWRQPLVRVLATGVAQEIPFAPPTAPSLWPRGTYALFNADAVASTVTNFSPDLAAAGQPYPPVPANDVVRFGLRVRRGEWRDAFSMDLGPRPPAFAERVERAAVEYPLDLPAGRAVRLRFSTATAEGSPAALWKLRVLPFEAPSGEPGAVVAEGRTGTAQWAEAVADMGGFAGRKVRVQLEAALPPGVSRALVYWAEPTIVVGDDVPAAVSSTSRTLAKLGPYEVRMWSGRRGLLDSTIGFRQGSAELRMRGFHVSVLGDALEDWRSASRFIDVREEPAGSRFRLRHRFESWAGPFDLLGEMWAEGGALRVRFWLENAPPPLPWRPVYIEDVAAGPWSEHATRVYAGQGNVIVEPRTFELVAGGHDLASSFVGFDFAQGISMVQGVDVPPDVLRVEPETRSYSLHSPHPQIMSLIPGPSVWAGAKVWRQVNGLKPAGGVQKLAGRFVIDVWNTRSADPAGGLLKSFRYGLTDSMVILHGWQTPPNSLAPARQKELAAMSQVSKQYGVLFSPHDNYIDFYPDAEIPGNPNLRIRASQPTGEGFTYGAVAFTRAGEPLKAWYLDSIHAQSYRARADLALGYAKRKWAVMNTDGIEATANFTDVWSSIGLWDYYSNDGQFFDRLSARRHMGEVFQWIREYLGTGPQTSEAGDDHLVGWLDGATAVHLRVDTTPPPAMVLRIPCAQAERVPWLDAAHHDRFVLHGAGYPERYAGGLDLAQHGVYSDDYIATEVLTGHPATANDVFGRDVVRKYWLLHDLMRGLALRNMDAFEFAGGDIHRQYIRWDNGAQVWVNRGQTDWTVEGHTLPAYGFYAHVPAGNGSIEAAIERRDGGVVEWSRSPQQVYRNARAEKNVPFRIAAEGDATVLTPLPDSPAGIARVAWSELPWKPRLPQRAVAVDIEGRETGQVSFRQEGAELVLEHAAGVFAYRLR